MRFLITLQNTGELGSVMRTITTTTTLQGCTTSSFVCTSFANLTHHNAFEKGKRKLGPLRPTLDGVQGPNS